jgi:hypothetical protein
MVYKNSAGTKNKHPSKQQSELIAQTETGRTDVKSALHQPKLHDKKDDGLGIRMN